MVQAGLAWAESSSVGHDPNRERRGTQHLALKGGSVDPTCVSLDPASPLARAQANILRANRRLERLEGLLWPIRPRRLERVGILREGMLGDVTVALAAMDLVRLALPDAEVVVLSSAGPRGAPGACDLLRARPGFELLQWHREDLATLRGRWQLVQRIAVQGLDGVVVLPAAMTTPRREALHALALAGARVGRARGFAVANGRYLKDPAQRSAHDQHNEQADAPDVPQARRLLEHAAAALTALGASDAYEHMPLADARNVLALTSAERERAKARLAALGFGAGRALLVLAPGGKLESKRWPEERFVELARRWCDLGGAALVLGSNAEKERAQAMVRTLRSEGGAAASVAGVTSVRDSAALLELAAVCVANDSGPAHLAAAVGTPTVELQSARDRRGAWDPEGSGGSPVRVLRAKVPCATCFLDSCNQRLRCLTDLTVDAAWQALAQIARDPQSALPESRAPLPHRNLHAPART